MDIHTFGRFKKIVAFFVAMIVSIAVTVDNFFLALAGVVIGMVFMFVIKSRVKGVLADERIQHVADKAARATYSIFTMVTGLSAFVITFLGRNRFPYLEALGTTLSYLTLFSIGIYSAAYFYYNKKYGADGTE